MSAPTYPATADLAQGTGTRAFGAVATNPEDWIVVEVIMDNNQAATAAPVTCPGLIFNIENTINHASAGTHVFGTQSTVKDNAGNASRVVTVTPSNANNYRAHLTVVRGSGGVGGKAVATAAQAVTLARVGDNSGIFLAVGDWSAGAVGSPVWAPGGATVASQQGSGTATYIFGRWDDSGTAGSASHGISSPSYGTPSIGVLEMLGSTGSSEPDVYPYGQRGPGPGPWDADVFVADPTSREVAAGVTQVTQTLDLRWASYASVSQTLDARWAVLSSVSQTVDLQWRVFSMVSQTSDLRWRVSVLVSQTSDLRWQVFNVVGQATDLRWLSYAAVTQTSDLRWRVSVLVSQTSDLRWLVFNAVTQSTDLRWRSFAQVSQTTDLRWVSLSSLVSVSQSLDLQWRVSVLVSATTDLRWRVAQLVTGTTDLRWAVRALVAQSLSTPWAVLGVVAGTLDMRWRVYVGMAATHELLWRVLALVQAELEMLWVQEETTLPVPAQVVFLGVDYVDSVLDVVHVLALAEDATTVGAEVHLVVDLDNAPEA